MTSAIDTTKPQDGSATTQSVRDNFAAAKTEIEDLQARQNPIPDAPDVGKTLRVNGDLEYELVAFPDVQFTGNWSAVTTYDQNNVVTSNRRSYYSKVDSNLNNEPALSPTEWGLLVDLPVNWQGDWDSGTNYVSGDAVAHEGSSYICLVDHTNQEPPNVTYWDVLAEKGDTGDTGAQGIQGIQGIQGTQGMIWEGAWSGVTAYTVDDVVENDGTSYICIQDHTNQEPPNASYWEVVAEKGDTGATGATGPQGDIGPAGESLTLTYGELTGGSDLSIPDGSTNVKVAWTQVNQDTLSAFDGTNEDIVIPTNDPDPEYRIRIWAKLLYPDNGSDITVNVFRGTNAITSLQAYTARKIIDGSIVWVDTGWLPGSQAGQEYSVKVTNNSGSAVDMLRGSMFQIEFKLPA